jgi:dTDP-glucose pyrophosphorylase
MIVNVIPLAGEGRRYADAGYTTPKPLVPVNGLPMVVRAARSLPPPDKWVFICRQAFVDEHAIDTVLQAHFPGAVVLPIEKVTEGQACTCLLARKEMDPGDILHIGACDNAMTYNRADLDAALADPGTDALIWTFRHNPAVLQNPKMYGWVAVGPDGRSATRVSCKIPISTTPMEDHAVIGAFTFKRASDFIRSAEALIAANRRINNEFYVDEAMNVAIESGLRVKVMEVHHYICWGTPQDLTLFNYWQGALQELERQ